MPTPFSDFVKLNIKTDNLIGVEIGVFQGINAVYLLQDLPIKRLYLVDNYKPYWSGGTEYYNKQQMDSYYEIMFHNAEPYFDKVMPIKEDSSWAMHLFPNLYFDFVYIDAGHTYDEVMDDMNNWWDLTKSGGVFGGHDYGTINGHDVKKAVDDFLKIKGIEKDPSLDLRVGEAMEWAVIKP